MRKTHLFILAASMLMLSCLRRDEFSNIPRIEYKEINKEEQSLWIRFSFTDGDGDIGLSDDQIYPPYGPCDDHYYNLIIDPYRTVNGEFVLARVPVISECSTDTSIVWDTVGYDQRIKVIEVEGKDNTLDGEINVKINEVLDDFPGDTIMFKIRLWDRALNVSNEIETDVIITS